jgi:hypothetical protein
LAFLFRSLERLAREDGDDDGDSHGRDDQAVLDHALPRLALL